MTFADLVPIASSISSLAAATPLIFIGIQIRHSGRDMRAQIHLRTAARTSTLLLRLMDSDKVAVWIEGNGDTPPPALIRQRQFHFQCGVMMSAMENNYGQHQDRLTSNQQFARLSGEADGPRPAHFLAGATGQRENGSAGVCRVC